MAIRLNGQVQYDITSQNLIDKGYTEEYGARYRIIIRLGLEYRTNVFSNNMKSSEKVIKVISLSLRIILTLGLILVSSEIRLHIKFLLAGKKIIILKSIIISQPPFQQPVFRPVQQPVFQPVQQPVQQPIFRPMQNRLDQGRYLGFNSYLNARSLQRQHIELSSYSFSLGKTEELNKNVYEMMEKQGINLLKEYSKTNNFISLDSVNYFINFKENCLTISCDGEDLIIPFENGNLVSLKDIGFDLKKVPNLHKMPLRDLIRKVYGYTSKYSYSHGTVNISLVKNSLMVCADYHLAIFSKLIKNYPNTKIKINFLNDDLTNGVGYDFEGLTKDYFNDLMKGLMIGCCANFKEGASAGLFLPQAKEKIAVIEFDEESNIILPETPLPQLTDKEKRLYENLGCLLMFAHKHKINLGQHLDYSLFNMIFSLMSEDVTTELKSEKLLSLCQIYADNVKKSGYNDQLVKILEFLNNDVWSKEDCVDFGSIADAVETVHPKYQTDGFFNYEKIKDNLDQFSNEMFILIMNCLYKTPIKEVLLGNLLEPMLAIARGMHDFATRNQFDWNVNLFFNKTFCERIQGSICREKIANCFKIVKKFDNLNQADAIIDVNWDVNNEDLDRSTSEIKKKINWLRDWIKNEATVEEIKDFLKFVTGTNSLLDNVTIEIISQAKRTNGQYSPTPVVHTCFNQIELSPEPCGDVTKDFNDHTKENFIALIKEHCLKNTGHQFA